MSALISSIGRVRKLDIAARAALLSFSSNGALLVIKLAAGLLFGSVAVLSDAVDSAEDMLASGIVFFTVRLALQPADEAHPYGHGKAESLAALSQAALIAGGAVFITIAAGRRLAAGEADIATVPSLVAIGAAIAVNVLVSMYSFRAARISGSVAIAADARHLLTNVVQGVAIGAGLLLVLATGNEIFDPLIALGLAAYLGWIAGNILRAALSELLDTALPDEEVATIEACLARELHGMRGFHELRTRKSGRQKHVDLHVLVDPALSVSEAHHLVEEIESGIHGCVRGAVVSVHIDPDEPGIMERRRGSEHEASGDEILPVHRHQ